MKAIKNIFSYFIVLTFFVCIFLTTESHSQIPQSDVVWAYDFFDNYTINDVAFSNDAKYVIVSVDSFFTWAPTGNIIVFETNTGNLISNRSINEVTQVGVGSYVNSFSNHPTLNKIAVGFLYGVIIFNLPDLDTEKIIWTDFQSGHVQYNSTGELLFVTRRNTSDETIGYVEIIDAETGDSISTLQDFDDFANLIFTANNKYVISENYDPNECNYLLWDAHTFKKIGVFTGNYYSSWDSDISDDSRFFISSIYDSSIIIWDIESKNIYYEYIPDENDEDAWAIKFLPDSKHFAAAFEPWGLPFSPNVKIINIETHETEKIFSLSSDDGIDIDQNSEFLLCASYNDVVLLKLNLNLSVDNNAEIFANNYVIPNPFSEQTKITFNLDNPSYSRITIYNSLGKIIEVLANDYLEEGNHEITFDGSTLPGGTYFFVLQANGKVETGKLILIK